MHVYILLLLAVAVNGQVFLTVDGIQNVTVPDSGYIVYGQYSSLNLTFAGPSDAVCGALCVASFVDGPLGFASFTVEPGITIRVNGSGDAQVRLDVLWCTDDANAAFFSNFSRGAYRTDLRKSETVAVVRQGQCAQDSRIEWPPLTPVVSVATGDFHACEIVGSENATVACFGSNNFCQLGSGSSTDSPRVNPVYVTAVGIIEVPVQNGLYASRTQTCVVNAENVYCWGSFSQPVSAVNCLTYKPAFFKFPIDVPSNNHDVTVAIGSSFIAVYQVATSTLQIAGTAQFVLNAIRDASSEQITANTDSYYPILRLVLSPGTYYVVKPIPWGGLLLTSTSDAFVMGNVNLCTRNEYAAGSTGMCSILASCCTTTYFTGGNFDSIIIVHDGIYDVQLGGTALASFDTSEYGSWPLLTYATTYLGLHTPESVSRVTYTDYTLCYTDNEDLTCLAINIYGQSPLSPVSPTQFNSVTVRGILDVSAGTYATCYLLSSTATMRCAGAYGTGVVAYVLDPATGLGGGDVPGPVGISAPLYLRGYPWELSSSASLLGGTNYTLSGAAGCMALVTLDDGTNVFSTRTCTANRTNAGVQRAYIPEMNVCLEITTCVSSLWRVASTSPQFGCVAKVAAGAHHTCLLTCDYASVYCAGMTYNSPYIPASHADARSFNRVQTGPITCIGNIYSNYEITCFVSCSKDAILCVGYFGGTVISQALSINTLFLHSGTTIVDVIVGMSVVCATLHSGSGYQIKCTGSNEYNILQQPSFTPGFIGWTTLIDANLNPITIASKPTVTVYEIIPGYGCIWLMATTIVYMNGQCAEIYSNFLLPQASNVSFVELVTSIADGTFPMGPANNYAGLLSFNPSSGSNFYISARALGPPTMFYLMFGPYYFSGLIYATQRRVGFKDNLNDNIFFDLTNTSLAIVNISVADIGFAAIVNRTSSGGQLTLMIYDVNRNVAESAVVGNGIAQVAVGLRHVVVVTVDGQVCCLGDNSQGACGRFYTNISLLHAFVCIGNDTYLWPYTSQFMDPPTVDPETVIVDGGDVHPQNTMSETQLIITVCVGIGVIAIIIGILVALITRYYNSHFTSAAVLDSLYPLLSSNNNNKR